MNPFTTSTVSPPTWMSVPRFQLWARGDGGTVREAFERITGKCYNCRVSVDRVFADGSVFTLHENGIVLVDGEQGHSIYRMEVSK